MYLMTSALCFYSESQFSDFHEKDGPIFELWIPDISYSSYSRAVVVRVCVSRGADVDYKKACEGENLCTYI